jgi:hypothetical protein
MSSVTQAAAHRRGRSLTHLSGAGIDPVAMRIWSRVQARSVPVGGAAQVGSLPLAPMIPKLPVLGARHLAPQSPSERGSE